MPPQYEYIHVEPNVCPRFDTFQKVSSPPLETCPKCGKAVKRAISRVAFVMKKSGRSSGSVAKEHYERTIGHKIEKNQTFYTVPCNQQVIETTGMSLKQKEEVIHKAHLDAKDPTVDESSKVEVVD